MMNRLWILLTLTLMLIAAPALALAQDGDKTIGVGVGWNLPDLLFSTGIVDLDGDGVADLDSTVASSLLLPNTVSGRYRLASGLTIEPSLALVFGSGKQGLGPGVSDTDIKYRQLGLTIGVRQPVFEPTEKTAFHLSGILSFDQLASNVDPAGPDNDVDTTRTTVGVNWGVGVETWAGERLSISADLMNPLIESNSTVVEVDSEEQTSTTLTTFGLTFAPAARVMVHWWY